jgi:hypothetical protein
MDTITTPPPKTDRGLRKFNGKLRSLEEMEERRKRALERLEPVPAAYLRNVPEDLSRLQTLVGVEHVLDRKLMKN